MMRRIITFRIVAACVLAASLAFSAGCGKDDSGAAPASKPATKPAPAQTARTAPAASAPVAAPPAAAATPIPANPKPGEAITNAIGVKLIYIPPGAFEMGSSTDEPGRHDDEMLHRVRLTDGFWIGATEVTQAQWRAVMGSCQAEPKGNDLPASKLSWSDAVDFCRKLSQRDGHTYRLPTEAQWEYACRAGSAGPFSGGEADDVAWHMDNSDEIPHAVAGKTPNAWGLHDMHGNLAEWCSDYYTRDLGVAAVTDPQGPAEGKFRVVRGGSWGHFPRACRSAARASFNPAYRLDRVGLRVVLDPAATAHPTSTAPSTTP